MEWVWNGYGMTVDTVELVWNGYGMTVDTVDNMNILCIDHWIDRRRRGLSVDEAWIGCRISVEVVWSAWNVDRGSTVDRAWNDRGGCRHSTWIHGQDVPRHPRTLHGQSTQNPRHDPWIHTESTAREFCDDVLKGF